MAVRRGLLHRQVLHLRDDRIRVSADHYGVHHRSLRGYLPPFEGSVHIEPRQSRAHYRHSLDVGLRLRTAISGAHALAVRSAGPLYKEGGNRRKFD